MKSAALLLIACSLAIGGGGGYLLGSDRVAMPDFAAIRLLMAEAPAVAKDAPSPGVDPVIYYRHPDGAPAWSAKPAKTSDGTNFVPVLASQDVSFADKPQAREADSGIEEAGSGHAPATERKIRYYRNPMGLPDTSKVPKKDSMGMDYIPVYEGEGEAEGGSTVRVPLGKLQRTGVRTAEVKRERLPTRLRVPGIVMLDDRRIHAVSMRSDSFIEDYASRMAEFGSEIGGGKTEEFGQFIVSDIKRYESIESLSGAKLE